MEQVIWHQLFEVAQGLKAIEDAAKYILETIPSNFDNIDDNIRKFGMFADLFIYPPDNSDTIIHLSSNLIEIGTIPENWPLASSLLPLCPDNRV